MLVEQPQGALNPKLIPVSLWSMNDQATGEMCVADPAIIESSTTMETCGQDANDTAEIIDLDPPQTDQDGPALEIKIDKVFSVKPGSGSRSVVYDEGCVILSDEEADSNIITIATEKSQPKAMKSNGGQSSESVSSASEVSAEIISEIDNEILKSLKGSLINFTSLLGGVKDQKGRHWGNRQVKTRSLNSSPVPLQSGTEGLGSFNVGPQSRVGRRIDLLGLNGDKVPGPDSDIHQSSSGNGAVSKASAKDLAAVKRHYTPGEKSSIGHPGTAASEVTVARGDKQTSVQSASHASDKTSALTASLVSDKTSVKQEPGVPGKLVESKKEVDTGSGEPKDSQAKDRQQDDEVVWICFVCAKGYPNQKELMAHQDSCEEELPLPTAVPGEGPKPALPIQPAPPTQSAQSEPPISVTCTSAPQAGPSTAETDTVLKVEPLDSSAVSWPVPTLLTKVGSGIKSLPLGLPQKVRRRKPVKEIYIPPPKGKFFECLGLGETPTVEEIFKSPRKSVSEDDCKFIDLTVDEEKSPISSPMTPRTRSLMSQLSRDESGRKRHLSFCGSPARSEVKSEVSSRVKPNKEESSESDSSEEEGSKRRDLPCKTALLGIPLSSPLGQRLKKHWQNEYKGVPVISNIEMYCKTQETWSDIEEELTDQKNPMMDKLRHRPPPQVTFRFTKKYLNKWFHRYKFNKADQREFEKTLWTGLERESRIRAKQMKPCKVVLKKLTKSEINLWRTPRVHRLVHPNVKGLHRFSNVMLRGGQPGMGFLRSMRPVRQSGRQPVMNQGFMRRAQGHRFPQGYPSQALRYSSPGGPTPQLLVRPHGRSSGNMRLEVRTLHNTLVAMPGCPAAQQSLQAAGIVDRRSQKRKQSFHQVRMDNNEVICLSSDEEEEAEGCSKCALAEGTCSKHKSGPSRDQTKRLRLSGPVTPASPVKAGGVLTDSASSRVFGKTLISTNPVLDARQGVSGFNQFQIKNGTVTQQVPAQIQSFQGSSVSASGPAGHRVETLLIKADITDEKAETKRSQSDSEYLDYEVICIDSDCDE